MRGTVQAGFGLGRRRLMRGVAAVGAAMVITDRASAASVSIGMQLGWLAGGQSDWRDCGQRDGLFRRGGVGFPDFAGGAE